MLSDRDLSFFLRNELIVIEPMGPDAIQPSSIDLRLDKFFRVFNNNKYTHIDPSIAQPELTELVEVPYPKQFALHPGEFVLASTQEVVTLTSGIAAQLNGKSSLGRLGLLVHSTAGFIDPGFSGHITLELSNVANLPIVLYPGMKIAQLVVFELRSTCLTPYGSKATSRYQDQRGPTPSRSHQNFITALIEKGDQGA